MALAAPTGSLAHELRVFDSQPEMATTAITYQDGRLWPSTDPGLGVTSFLEFESLDWEAAPQADLRPTLYGV